jgi:PST family polysaccharide transporter
MSGVRWLALARLATEVIVLGSSVLLARLVSPAEFGLAAVVRIVPAFAVILTFEGLGTMLVQRAQVGQEHLRTAAALSLLAGAGLSLATFLVAPLVAGPLFGSQSVDLLQLTAPAFLLAAPGVVPRAMLQRRLDFRRLTLVQVTALALGSIASVALALSGLEAEALVLGPVIATYLEASLLFLLAPSPMPRLERRAASEILSFGLPAALAGAAYVARRNVDYVILGASLPPAAVGYYYRAFQVGAEYQSRVTNVMMLVAFPVFSRTADQETMRSLRLKIVRTNAILVFPLLTAFVITAPVLIPFVYGEEWNDAVVPAQILALAGLALAILSGTEPLTLAAGRPRLLLRFNVVFLIAVAVAAATASTFGLIAVCIAIALVHVAALIGGQHYLVNRILDVPLRQLWDDLSPALMPTAAMAAAGTVLFVLGRRTGLPDLAVVAATVAVGALAYAMCLRALHPGVWVEMRRLARRFSGRPQRGAAGGPPQTRRSIEQSAHVPPERAP